MTACERCASDLPDGLAAAYCPYCGHSLNSGALAGPLSAAEILPPGAPDIPPRRMPTFVLAPLPKRRVPAVYDAPPSQPTYTSPQPYTPPSTQTYYAPPPALAQPIEIHITQTQGGGYFSNCFTVLGIVVFLLVLLPLLCGLMGMIGSAGWAAR